MGVSRGGGYTQKEKESFRPIIYNNLVSQMKVLIGASAPLNSPISEANLVRVGRGKCLEDSLS